MMVSSEISDLITRFLYYRETLKDTISGKTQESLTLILNGLDRGSVYDEIKDYKKGRGLLFDCIGRDMVPKYALPLNGYMHKCSSLEPCSFKRDDEMPYCGFLVP